MEREGKGFTLEGNTNPRYMTELQEEIAKIDKRQEEDPSWQRSDEELKVLKDDAARKIYGRFWIWEGYYNEANNQKWLDTANDLKSINDHVLQDVEDYILLESFKGMKPDKIRDFIENDHELRLNE